MKNNKIFLCLFALCVFAINAKAQTTTTSKATSQSYWQLAPRIGFDVVPMYNNNTTFIDNKGGLEAGLSVDYYKKWYGFGFDADYIKNKPKSTYPTTNLQNAAFVNLTSFSIIENTISRTFIGLGPSFKYQKPLSKFKAELNTRIGIGSVNGGRVEHRETTTLPKELLNFHAGYNAKSLLSFKLQLRTSYFLNANFGISAGAYYINHFKVPELVDPLLGFSYKHISQNSTLSSSSSILGATNYRVEPCNCNVSSIGAFVGIVYKLGGKKKKAEEVCLPEYSLAVTAKDKITGALLTNTEVKVNNAKGDITMSGITNNFGVVVFEKIMPDDYAIAGTLANVALDGSSATKAEFLANKNKVVQKVIYYSDRSFIIKGKIFECNSTKTIAGITVVLESKDGAYKKTTITDADGSYVIQLPETGNFILYGKKGKYFSQIEEVNSSNYNRAKNLFVQLEICAEPVDCGKAIGLKNILFDLDKYVIKDAAKPELNKLVRFMLDNPNVKVEVGSHTDCRNTDAYNQTLSQNRANASVDYIVSQGISRDRITGKGYGETVLLNRCADGVNCSEAEHSINRRTEMKVICNN